MTNITSLADLKAPDITVTLKRGGQDFTLSVRPLMSAHLEQIRTMYPDPKAPRIKTVGPQGNEIVRPDFSDEDYTEKASANARKQSRAMTVMALGLPFFGTEDFEVAVGKVNESFSLQEIVEINRSATQMSELSPDMIEEEKEKMLPFDTTQVEAANG